MKSINSNPVSSGRVSDSPSDALSLRDLINEIKILRGEIQEIKDYFHINQPLPRSDYIQNKVIDILSKWGRG